MKRRSSALLHRLWISDREFFSPNPIEGENWIDFNNFREKSFCQTYQVSNKGRVRLKGSSTIISGSIDIDGYHDVSLRLLDENKYVSIRIHCLVLSLFKGDPPSDMIQPTVQHLNHEKLDNRVENLCWMSAFDNNQEGHGTKVMLIDDSGEHIFPSQKFASKYIGRHDDYISEGVSCGYKLTKSDGSTFELYVFVDGEWRKYCKPVSLNRRKCKLILKGSCFEFDSTQECDRFLNRPKGYVSNTVCNGWPILPDEEHQFYLWNYSLSKLEEYVPTKRKVRSHSIKCEVIDSNSTVKEFSSISAAARYLDVDSEYLRLAVKQGRSVKDGQGIAVDVRISNSASKENIKHGEDSVHS